MTIGEIHQVIVGFASLIATITVSIVIYMMQRKHEKEINDLRDLQHQKDVENRANSFLIDNEGEKDYLPFCVIASSMYRHKKHTRKIYTEFCRCSNEVQVEILKQAEFNMPIIPDGEWFDSALKDLRKDIEEHKLGKDYLYDGGKYLYRNFDYYREEQWTDITEKECFPYIATRTGFFRKQSQNFISYVEEYFYYLYSETRPMLYNPNPVPPVDLAWNMFGLANSEEIETCRWMLEIVFSIVVNIHNRKYEMYTISNTYTDAQIDTFEDKYYETLLWMYYTYILENNIESK